VSGQEDLAEKMVFDVRPEGRGVWRVGTVGQRPWAGTKDGHETGVQRAS
jgi:hypothetical protein